MKSNFRKSLLDMGEFSTEKLEALEYVAIKRVVERDEVLLRQGEICNSCFFLEHGAAYQCKIDEDNEKQIIDLYLSNAWVLNVQSFTQRQISDHYIISLVQSEIYEIRIDDMHELLERFPSLIQLGKIFGVATSRITRLDQMLTAREKYNYLMKHNPELFLHFPHHMIASYLKITPETLSRIRRQAIS